MILYYICHSTLCYVYTTVTKHNCLIGIYVIAAAAAGEAAASKMVAHMALCITAPSSLSAPVWAGLRLTEKKP